MHRNNFFLVYIKFHYHTYFPYFEIWHVFDYDPPPHVPSEIQCLLIYIYIYMYVTSKPNPRHTTFASKHWIPSFIPSKKSLRGPKRVIICIKAMACWSAENATKAYLNTLKMVSVLLMSEPLNQKNFYLRIL